MATTPTVRAVGTIAGGTGAISPGLPAGTVAGDWLCMVIETFRAEAATAAGWTALLAIDSGDDAGANNTDTRLTILYRIAASGSDATTTNDVADHCIGRIIGITAGTYCREQFLDVAVMTSIEDAVDTTGSISGCTTVTPNCLIITAVSCGLDGTSTTGVFSAWTNAALTNGVEQIDNRQTAGNGGSIGVQTWTKATAGAVDATTVTTPSSYKAMACIAISPNWPTYPIVAVGQGAES